MMMDKSVTILNTISLKWLSVGLLRYVDFLHDAAPNS